jgi:hypothetical protein
MRKRIKGELERTAATFTLSERQAISGRSLLVVSVILLLAGLIGVLPAWGADNHADREPLIVLPALVVRCDTTPDAATRQSRPGYCVNVNGQAIKDPSANPKVPALESDPELRWEAFDEYWRKIHGPKIIHVDGPSDHVTVGLLRYEQQHRVASGPTSAFHPPYLPEVDASGLLITDPWAHVPGYKRPSFDGLAQLAFATRDDFNAFFGVNPGDKYHDKIQPDEKVFLKGFAFNISKEFIIIPDQGSRDPVIFVKTHKRNPSLTREQFQDRWLEHAKLVVSDPTTRKLVKRYAQLHNISVPSDAPFFDPVGNQFDGITVMSFANPNDLEDFLTSDAYEAIVEDENNFIAESEFFTAINYTVINRLGTEGRTSTQ